MMSAFQTLKEVSKNFEDELHRASNDLSSAKIEESFEDNIAKKLHDLSLFISKSRLLRAKTLSLTPQISEQERDSTTTLKEYEDTVLSRIIEQQVVKSVTQGHAVKTLVMAPDRTLDPEMVERKEKIIAAIAEYQIEEATIQQLEEELREREEQLFKVRAEWDMELAELRKMKQFTRAVEVDEQAPLYQKLNALVKKLEEMRWLLSRVGVPPSQSYDWLADPHNLLRAIKLARTHYTVDHFLS